MDVMLRLQTLSVQASDEENEQGEIFKTNPHSIIKHTAPQLTFS